MSGSSSPGSPPTPKHSNHSQKRDPPHNSPPHEHHESQSFLSSYDFDSEHSTGAPAPTSAVGDAYTPLSDDDSLNALEEEFAEYNRQQEARQAESHTHDDLASHTASERHDPPSSPPSRRAPDPPSHTTNSSPHSSLHESHNKKLSPTTDSLSESDSEEPTSHSANDLKQLRRMHSSNKSKEAPSGEQRPSTHSDDSSSDRSYSSPRRKRKHPAMLRASDSHRRSKRSLIPAYDPLGGLDDSIDPQFAEPPQGRQKLRHSPPAEALPHDSFAYSQSQAYSPPHTALSSPTLDAHQHSPPYSPAHHVHRNPHSPLNHSEPSPHNTHSVHRNAHSHSPSSPPLHNRPTPSSYHNLPPQHWSQPMDPTQPAPYYPSEQPPHFREPMHHHAPPTQPPDAYPANQHSYLHGYDVYGRPIYSPHPPQSYHPSSHPQYPPLNQPQYPPYPQQQNPPPQLQPQYPNQYNHAPPQNDRHQHLAHQREENQRLLEQIDSIKRERDELAQQNTKNSNLNDQYHSQLQAENRENESQLELLQQRIASLEQENRDLLNSKDELLEDNQNMKSHLERMHQKMLDKSKELQQTQQELTDLRFQTTESDSQISEMKQKDIRLEESVQSAQTKNIALQKKLDSETNARRKVEESLARVEMQYNDSQNRIKELQADIEKKNTEISNMNHQLDSIRNELQKSKDIQQASQDELDDLRVKKENIQTQLKESTNSQKADQATLREYILEADNLKKESHRAQQQADHLKKENAYLQTQVRNLKDTIHTLESQQKNYVRAKETAQTDYNRLRADFDAVLLEKEELQKDLNNMQREMQHSQSQRHEHSDHRTGSRYETSKHNYRNNERSSEAPRSYARHPNEARSPPPSNSRRRRAAPSREAPFATSYGPQQDEYSRAERTQRTRRDIYSDEDMHLKKSQSPHGANHPLSSHSPRSLPVEDSLRSSPRSSSQDERKHSPDYVPSAQDLDKLMKVVDYYHRSMPSRSETENANLNRSRSPRENGSYAENPVSTPAREPAHTNQYSSPETTRTVSSESVRDRQTPSSGEDVVASKHTPFANQHSLTEQIQNTARQEKELMNLNLEKNELESELQKLFSSQRTMAKRRRRIEVEKRLEEIAKRQSSIRMQLRNAGAL